MSVFPYGFFRIFLVSDFLQFEYNLLRYHFLGGEVFSCLVFSELPESVVWCLTLTWGNSQSSFFQIFVLLLVFLLRICYGFCSPTVLLISCISFWFFLKIPVFPLTLFTSSCMLPALSKGALSILIVALSYFQCDDFNILATSGSEADSVF